MSPWKAALSGARKYPPQVATQLAGAGAAGFAGNALLGGLIGMGVDASTGATFRSWDRIFRWVRCRSGSWCRGI